jgi:hypothetical protein
MALPVIKATKFNYGAYAQPKQVKFKDPNLGIAAGIASVGKQVMQEIEENKLQEQKNNITIAKNNSEYKYAATQLQNQFGDGVDKYVQGLVDRFADNEKFRVSNPDNLEQYLNTKNQLNGLLQQLLAVKQKGVALKKNFKDMDVNNLTGSSLDNYNKADSLINERFELSDKDGELFISLTTPDFSKVKPSGPVRGIDKFKSDIAEPDFSNVFTKQEPMSNYMLDESYFDVDTKWNTTDSNFTQALTKIGAAAKNQKIQLEKRQDINVEGNEAYFLTEKGVSEYLNSPDNSVNENLDKIIQQSGKKIYEDEIAGAVGGYDPNNADQNTEIKNYLINKLIEQGSFKDGMFITSRAKKKEKEEKVDQPKLRSEQVIKLFNENTRVVGTEIEFDSVKNLEAIIESPSSYGLPESIRPALNNYVSSNSEEFTQMYERASQIVKSTNLKTLEKADQNTKDNFKAAENFVKLYNENKNKNVVINLQTNAVEKDFERLVLQLAFGPSSRLSSDIFQLNEYMTNFGLEGTSALKYPKSVGNMTFDQYLAETQKISDSRLQFTDAVKNAVKMEYNRLKNK